MSPRTARPAAPQLVAGPGCVVDAFEAEHDYWDEKAKQHRCDRCVVGLSCRTFDYYAKQADAAGWRLAEAKRRESLRSARAIGAAQGEVQHQARLTGRRGAGVDPTRRTNRHPRATATATHEQAPISGN